MIKEKTSILLKIIVRVTFIFRVFISIALTHLQNVLMKMKKRLLVSFSTYSLETVTDVSLILRVPCGSYCTGIVVFNEAY